MTRQSMIELIIMYEQHDKIDKVQELLIGNSFSLGFNDGVFGIFTYVDSIIRRECNQSLVNPAIDLEDNKYYNILKANISVEEKADALMKKNEE